MGWCWAISILNKRKERSTSEKVGQKVAQARCAQIDACMKSLDLASGSEDDEEEVMDEHEQTLKEEEDEGGGHEREKKAARER